jgi:hypothetical protein
MKIKWYVIASLLFVACNEDVDVRAVEVDASNSIFEADDIQKIVYLKPTWMEGGITNTTHEGVRVFSKKDLFKKSDSVDFALLVRKDLLKESKISLIIRDKKPNRQQNLVRVEIPRRSMDAYPDEWFFFVELAPELFSKAVFHFSTGKHDISIHCKTQMAK